MAQVVKQFSYNTNLEGWVFLGSAQGMTGTRDTTEDSPNDPNAGTGVMQGRRVGQNLTTGFFAWQWGNGTQNWESLGVPAGATVTAVKLDYDWRCSEYTTGSPTSKTGPAELRSGDDTTVRGTFSAAETFGATSSFVTKAGTAITGLSDASNTTISLRVYTRPYTGDSPSAAVTLRQDWVVVTITYTPGTTAVGRSLSSTWNIRAAVGRSRASTWNIREAVGRSRASTWNIRTTAGKSIASAWNIREAAGAEFDSAWNIRALAGRSFASSWNIEKLATPPEPQRRRWLPARTPEEEFLYPNRRYR